jgi:hypothetical protein
MQIALKVLVGAMLLILALVVFSSKNENSFLKNDRPANSIPHTYYYYPKANFYYDSTDGKYICRDTTEAGWIKTDKLPLQQDDIGKRVRIGAVAEPVWSENEHHRMIYSVSLYSEPKDFKQPRKEEPKKPIVVVDTLEIVKKSGVKKFFERIFPPKKKKDSAGAG